LNPGASNVVRVLFDSSEVDKLSEGLFQLNCTARLTSPTFIAPDFVPPTPVAPPAPVVVPPPPPPVQTGFGSLQLTTRRIKNPLGVPLDKAYAMTVPIDINAHWDLNTPSIYLGRFDYPVYARYDGELFLEPGTYEFHVTPDDGFTFTFNGKVVYDSWQSQAPYERVFMLTVAPGEPRNTIIEYYNGIDFGDLHLNWKKIS
jgi:hypothetical protein